MNSKMLFISLTSIILVIFLNGCDELEDLNKPNYIDVIVYCNVNALLFPKMESIDDPQTLPAKFLQLNVEIIKDGGERFQDMVNIFADGSSSSVYASFKLYRKQPITCIANVVMESAIKDYPDYTFNSDSKTITWNEIYPANDFGDTVRKYITLNVYGTHKDM